MSTIKYAIQRNNMPGTMMEQKVRTPWVCVCVTKTIAKQCTDKHNSKRIDSCFNDSICYQSKVSLVWLKIFSRSPYYSFSVAVSLSFCYNSFALAARISTSASLVQRKSFVQVACVYVSTCIAFVYCLSKFKVGRHFFLSLILSR